MRRTFHALLPALTLSLPAFKVMERGERGTKGWRLTYEHSNGSGAASAWHDLPLKPTSDGGSGNPTDPRIYTYVNEIPRGTRAKMELLKEETHNPIGQDIFKKKEGKPLRYFTYGDMPFNYGFIPRTWEDPDITNAATQCVGDGDPIDVVQLGPSPIATGTFLPVRVLGVLALIDEGETDWKIIAESVIPGKEADGYGSLDKVPQEIQDAITDWFRNYKTTDGKPQNEFAFGGRIRNADDALVAIEECAGHYAALLQRKDTKHGYWLP